MATGCRSAAGPGSRRSMVRLCRQHELRVLVLSDDYVSLSKSVPVIPRCGHQMCSLFFREERGLKNRQKPLRFIFRPSLADRSRSRVRASFLCTWTVNPAYFFLFCHPLYISRVSLFFFLSSTVALHKHWRMLDHLTASSAAACFGVRSISLGGKISSRTWRFLYKLSELSCGFCCCCFFFIFFQLFFLYLSFSLWWLRTLFLWVENYNSLGVHVDWDVIHSTTTQCVDIGFAFKVLGHFAMGKRAGFFGAHSVQAQRRWGWPCQGLPGALEKKSLRLRDVSKPEVPYTGQPANLHRANTRIKRKISRLTLVLRSFNLRLPYLKNGSLDFLFIIYCFFMTTRCAFC